MVILYKEKGIRFIYFVFFTNMHSCKVDLSTSVFHLIEISSSINLLVTQVHRPTEIHGDLRGKTHTQL